MATLPILPDEMIAEVARAAVDASLAPRSPIEDAPHMSTVVRRRAAKKRTRESIRNLRPLADAGGAFGAAVRRHPAWESIALDQGWSFIGSANVPMDYCDLATEFQALLDAVPAMEAIMPVPGPALDVQVDERLDASVTEAVAL